jgi:hypothetical protein
MPLFPELGPQYYDEKDKPILERMEANYAESIVINQSLWSEADQDTRFYSDDQTLWNDLYGNLPANRRRQFNFNRIRRIVDMVSGYQRKNRKSMIATAVRNGDDVTADQYTKILYWVNQHENVLETISDCFQGALITGMNLLHLWVDYRTDPVSGNIKVDTCSYNDYMIDPYFRKADLSDCNFIWKRSYLTQRECVSLFPDKAEEILGLIGPSYGNRDGKFQFMPESYQFSTKSFLTYDQYYYRDYRTQKLLVDTVSGETLEWGNKPEEELQRFLQAYPTVQVLEQEIPTCRLAIVIQGKVFYDGPNPMGIDKYPFIPVFAYYRPEMPYYPYRVQGMVRGLRDAQYLYNRRKIIELDILESQVNSGFIYKENALVNPSDVFLFGQGKGIALKDEAQIGDIQQVQAPQIPPSMIELSRSLAQEVQEISGVNEELLGSATDDKAGILSMLRQGAGLTTLQPLFDNLDRAQKLCGKVMLDIIQANFTPGKVQNIIKEQPAPQFYNKAFGEYDVVVEDGLNTSTQKQMYFAQLLQMREMNIPVPTEELYEAMTIQNKPELMAKIKQGEQQQAQMQQQQAQMQMAEIQSRIKLSDARAEADKGLAAERSSRVAENYSLSLERLAAANKEDELAFLNKIKAVKELENMDLDHLQKLVTMANQFKAQEQMQQEAHKAEVIQATQANNAQHEQQPAQQQMSPQPAV